MMPDFDHAREVRCVMEGIDAGPFTSILQGGFIVRCRTGRTIEDLLTQDFGITGEYLERRLSTVFLEGQCVDDIGAAVARTGATLALSSAMPGLAGATLRRKGALSSMRGSITHNENSRPTDVVADGFITLKLFNVLSGELGPIFLARGIYVKASELADLLAMRGGAFRRGCTRLTMDDRPVDPETLLNSLGGLGSGLVRLVGARSASR